jgi:hypothetical protein
MEPFQDDILSRRLDDLTHQMRMLTLSVSTFQLEQRQQRHVDRWDLAEATQKALTDRKVLCPTMTSAPKLKPSLPSTAVWQSTR